MPFDQVKRLIFDADDTLWENNIHYIKAADNLVQLLSETGVTKSSLEEEFQLVEKQVVKEKGYGSKNYLFILETLYQRYMPSFKKDNYQQRFNRICQDFEAHVVNPPNVFPVVPKILNMLAEKYKIYVLTKGNIAEQQQKLRNSDLLHLFDYAFVETEKDIHTYQRILHDMSWRAAETCMIGNSPKSDINPALRAGLYAVFIPYRFTWVFDDEPIQANKERLITIESFSDLTSIFV
jgi:putative hydrolase of the HAD superfamily